MGLELLSVLSPKRSLMQSKVMDCESGREWQWNGEDLAP